MKAKCGRTRSAQLACSLAVLHDSNRYARRNSRRFVWHTCVLASDLAVGRDGRKDDAQMLGRAGVLLLVCSKCVPKRARARGEAT